MASTEKKRFVFLYRQPSPDPKLSPDEMQRVFTSWMGWLNGLRQSGQLLNSDRLKNSGGVVRGTGGATVTDRPLIEAKEIVGGFMIVAATDLNQALEIAKACPGLEHGGSVEVRPIEPRPQDN